MALFNGIYRKIPGLPLADATSRLGKNWSWMLVTGICYIILGFAALAMPIASTVGLVLALAAVFVASGVIQLFQAFKLRNKQGGSTRFFQSFLALALGVFMFVYPTISMLGLSLAMSFYFFVNGAMQLMVAQAMAPTPVRFWAYVGSIGSFVLGFYIVFTFPLSSIWVPGTLLGIELVFSGVGLIGFSLAVRRLNRDKGLDKSKSDRTTKSKWVPTEQPT